MSKLRPEVSKKNRYWISKHRYYELKHFCLQYKEWKAKYLSLSEPYHTTEYTSPWNKGSIEWSDSTASMVMKREYYLTRMRLIERTAAKTDPSIGEFIFKGVTDGVGFTYLKSVMDIPCGRDMYYDRYRKFFWLLDTTLVKQG